MVESMSGKINNTESTAIGVHVCVPGDRAAPLTMAVAACGIKNLRSQCVVQRMFQRETLFPAFHFLPFLTQISPEQTRGRITANNEATPFNLVGLKQQQQGNPVTE
ncbi:hypothetical protein JOB18_017254 [Solea senegalensis]|uniref:Uncharacterized protein n=1 Tax=Solea senegalensis TaxID=28829 RepID=A0AAV6RU52_SOLSE|nr:hypothetical protein JOB18_017254 [Solea senegalensis]